MTIPLGQTAQVSVRAENYTLKETSTPWCPETALMDSAGVIALDGIVQRREDGFQVTLKNMGDQATCFLAGTVIGQLWGECSPGGIQSVVESKDIDHVPEVDKFEVLIQESCQDLDSGAAQQVREMLRANSHLFVGPNNPLGRTSLVTHEIHTGGARPVKQPLRRMSPAHWEIAEREIDKMLEQDVIEVSESPWASPVVLVRKKDSGEMRFCIDLRALNEVTIKDSYALANIHECLETMHGAQYFCVMDLASGYWQVMMKESDREKTAFTTKKGLFQFKTMPFGLSNAPSTFQRLMEQVLRGLQYQTCHVYLDDIVVFGRSFTETLQRLQEVFQRLDHAGLKLKPSKCSFFQREVKFLGHVIGTGGVACDHAKIEAVQQWKTPRNVKEVRSFLGLANYYRRFIADFSSVAAPITNLTEKGRPYQWTEECEVAFKTLKCRLTEAPILAFPSLDSSHQFILDTDASNDGLGAVLSQVQDGEEKVIAYASKRLNKAQRAYCTT